MSRPIGPDGFTPLAPDASLIERLAAERDEFEAERGGAWMEARRNYAAFVGAEAELARLRSAMERLADLFDSTPQWSMVHRNVATSIRTALAAEET